MKKDGDYMLNELRKHKFGRSKELDMLFKGIFVKREDRFSAEVLALNAKRLFKVYTEEEMWIEREAVWRERLKNAKKRANDTSRVNRVTFDKKRMAKLHDNWVPVSVAEDKREFVSCQLK